MPIYTIKDPDGKDWDIEGPAGATRDQIIERVTASTEYKNAQYIKQQKNRKISPEGLPDNATGKGGENTTSWLKATTKEEPYRPAAGDVWKSGKKAATDALETFYETLKNSNLTPEQKAFHRKAKEEQLAAESKDNPIDYERLPPELKLLHMAPGALAVGGAGLAGFLGGGPVGAAAGGGGMLAALTSGGGDRQRAQLELQGVDSSKAKTIGLLEGLAKPAAQVGATMGGVVTGGLGVPLASEATDVIKNAMLQDQIQGPRTPDFPIAPFQQGMDDRGIDAGMGMLAGLRLPTPSPAMRTPPPARPMPPPASGPAPFAPRTPPPNPPAGGGGGRPPAVTPKPGQSVRGAINENLATKLAEPVKTRPNIDIFLKAMDEAPKTTTATGKVVPPVTKAPTKTPEPTKGTPSGFLPPASPNPLGPTPTAAESPTTVQQASVSTPAPSIPGDEYEAKLQTPEVRQFLELSRSVAANEKDQEKDPLTQEQQALVGGDDWRKFSEARGYTPEQIEEFQRYLDAYDVVEREHGYEFAQSLAAPELVDDVLDSPKASNSSNLDTLKVNEDQFAPPEGKAPLPTLGKTATTPEIRQAIAAREPIETLPPNKRVQEGAGVSRQQVADQQALVKKLTYAGYKEVKPGTWVHSDGKSNWEKNVKALPERGITADADAARKRPVTPDDVTGGNAYARDIYKIPDHVDRLDRIWGMDRDGSFLPWIKNKRSNPAKINPESTFIIANYDLDLEDRHPAGVFNHLRENVAWLRGLPIPTSWEKFIDIVGPSFLSNGYDALSFRGEDDEPRLIPFNRANITYIPVSTATTITGEKVKEHVRQMRNVLWMQRDKNYIEETASLLKLHGRIKQGMTVEDLAVYAGDNAPSPGLRSISAQISSVLSRYRAAGLVGNVIIKFKPFGNAAGTFKIDLPEYSNKARLEIFINSADGLTYRTIIHELIHAVTITVLTALRTMEPEDSYDSEEERQMAQRYYDLRKKMGEFYSYMQQMFAAVPLDEDDDSHNRRMQKLLYNKSAWTENIHEVLAYVLTEPEFQRIMHSIPMEKGNGLWETTEAVREFHDIDENMNTLFYEAVKLFNEFAQQPIWQIKDLPKMLRNFPMAIYEARPEIRGPPDLDQALLNHLDDYGTVMVMSAGNANFPYEDGRIKLDAVTAAAGIPLVPVQSADEVFGFLQNGTVPQTQMSDAPMYFMVVPDSIFATWETTKPGLQANGYHYFLVDNTDYAPVIGPMRRMARDSFLDRQEAILLIRRKIDIPTAIKPYLEEDRARVRLDMLPKAVRQTLGQKTLDQLKEAEAWLDMPIEDALAIWRANPRDIPKSYEFWGQMVSGAETAAVLTNHPFIRWARGRISADIAEQAQMSQQIIKPMGEAYLSLSDAERVQVSNLMIQGDRREIEYDEPALRQMGLNDKQIEYFTLVREADNYLYDLWNQKRAHLGMPPIPFRKGHIPGIFSGDYHALVKVGDEIIGFVSANDVLTFNYRKNKVKDGNPGVVFTDLPKKKLDGAPLNGNLFDIYMELTKALGPNDPNIQNIQNVLQEFAKFDENRYLGFHVHELAKKGIWGSSGDKPWLTDKENADDLFDSLVRYFQEGTAHHNMLEFMQEMDKLFLDPEVNEKAPVVLKYLRDLYNHTLRHNPQTQGDYTKMKQFFDGMNPDKQINAVLHLVGQGPTNYHKMSGTVRYAFATWAMGLGNLSFSLLQLMQVPLFAPQMTMMLRKELGMSFTEGRADAAKAAMTLSKYLAHHITNGKSGAVFGSLEANKEAYTALTYAEDNNLINFTDIERALEHVVSPTRSKIDRVVNFNQRYAEALTRPLVFLWFFNLNRSAGLPMKEALETARHRTQFVMVPYDLRDRPMMYASLGSLGMAFGQLKTFMHSSTSQTWYYTKQMKKGTFKPFVYGTAMAMFFQGQMGLIGMQDVDNIVRAYNTSVNNENKGIREVMYETAPKWFTQGYMTEWTGVDFYSRLRSPGAIQWPLQNSIIPPAYNWLIDRVGDMLRIGLATPKMKTDWETIKKSTEFQKSVLGITPPPMKPILEETFGNKIYRSNAAPLEGYTRDDFDRTLRYMGMRSQKESKWLESNRDRMGDKYMGNLDLNEIKSKLIDAYRKGYYKDEVVSKLEDQFLEAGGSPAELKALMKTLPPETVDDDYFGRPSKRRAFKLDQLYNFDDKRREQ